MAVKYITRRAEDKKWCVKNANAEKATRVFNTQKEAIEYAKSLKSTTSILVQSREGKFRKVSKWDGIKTPTSHNNKRPVVKKPVVKKVTKPVVQQSIVEMEEVVEETKNQAIVELKESNAALDVEIAKEKAISEIEDLSYEEEIEDVEVANKQDKSVGQKVALALGILFFFVVVVLSILFVLDWKEVINFMDVI